MVVLNLGILVIRPSLGGLSTDYYSIVGWVRAFFLMVV